MKHYLETHHRALGLFGALITFGIALIYLKVVPEESSSIGGIQKMILMYGHSLGWAMLSGASILWSINRKNRWSAVLAYGALIAYLIFISTFLTT